MKFNYHFEISSKEYQSPYGAKALQDNTMNNATKFNETVSVPLRGESLAS